MAMNTVLKQEIDLLPPEDQQEVLDFVLFLRNKNEKSKKSFPFDAFKGGLKYIADDFDEIPEGFEEYV